MALYYSTTGSDNTATGVAIGASSAATTLQVVGDIRVGTRGTNGCIQAFGGTALAGTCSSDPRLKQNTLSRSHLFSTKGHRAVTYDWRADEYPDYNFGSGRTAGLIAQEVEKVFPNMVATDERGYKAVDYSQLPLLLLQAIRELKANSDATIQQQQQQQLQIQELKNGNGSAENAPRRPKTEVANTKRMNRTGCAQGAEIAVLLRDFAESCETNALMKKEGQ